MPVGHLGTRGPGTTGLAPHGRHAGRGAGGSAVPELDDAAQAVFERLRAWRAGVAKEQGVPAYVVFHDATLRDVVTRRPADLAELAGIGGVGAAKLERYGAGLLAALEG